MIDGTAEKPEAIGLICVKFDELSRDKNLHNFYQQFGLESSKFVPLEGFFCSYFISESKFY